MFPVYSQCSPARSHQQSYSVRNFRRANSYVITEIITIKLYVKIIVLIKIVTCFGGK